MRGLILFAHGARDARWASPFVAVAERTRQLDPDCVVRLAFLEFMAPDLLTAGADLVAQGCTRVDVLPLFLGAGGHVRKDLPARVAELQLQYPAVTWTLQAAAGESPDLIEALARMAAGLRRGPA